MYTGEEFMAQNPMNSYWFGTDFKGTQSVPFYTFSHLKCKKV
jgi:hypothetical protein